MGNNASTSQQDRIAYQSFVANYAYIRKVKDSRYGEISILEDKNTKEHVALKEILSKSTTDFKREIEELKNRSKISHPNIIRLIAYTSKAEDNLCASFYKILLIIDYVDQDFEREIGLRKANSDFYTEEQLWYILESILNALVCLQQHNVPHGDLKPSNIFVSKLGSYKLAEQSLLGNTMPSYAQRLSGFHDVRSYLSPALLKNLGRQELYPKHDSFKSDIFSLGLAMLHAASLMNCDKFFDWENCSLDIEGLQRRIGSLTNRYSEQFQHFIAAMLILDEQKRPSASDLVNRIPTVDKVEQLIQQHMQPSSYNTLPQERKQLQEQPQPQSDNIEFEAISRRDEESAKKSATKKQPQFLYSSAVEDQTIESELPANPLNVRMGSRPPLLKEDVEPSPMKPQEEPNNDNLRVLDQETSFPQNVNKASFAQFNSRANSDRKEESTIVFKVDQSVVVENDEPGVVENDEPQVEPFGTRYQPNDEISRILSEYRSKNVAQSTHSSQVYTQSPIEQLQQQQAVNSTYAQAPVEQQQVASQAYTQPPVEQQQAAKLSYGYTNTTQYTTVPARNSATGPSYTDSAPAYTPYGYAQETQPKNDAVNTGIGGTTTSSSFGYYKPSVDVERILQEIKNRSTGTTVPSTLTSSTVAPATSITTSSYIPSTYNTTNAYRPATSTYVPATSYQQPAGSASYANPSAYTNQLRSSSDYSRPSDYKSPVERTSANLEYNKPLDYIAQPKAYNYEVEKSSFKTEIPQNVQVYHVTNVQPQYVPPTQDENRQPFLQKENAQPLRDNKENYSRESAKASSVQDILNEYRKKDQVEQFSNQGNAFIGTQQPQQAPQTYAQPNNFNPLQPLSFNVQSNGQRRQGSARTSYNAFETVTEHYADGSIYEGEKRDNFRHGKGRFYYSDGGLYDGDWKAGSMDGIGTLYYAGGQVAYEGEWREDKFHGKGVVHNEIPVGFTGEFDYSNFDNLADYWMNYEGGFLDDNKEGFGTLYLTNGDRFEGEFKEDMVHGRGAYIFANGQKFVGEWWNNRL